MLGQLNRKIIYVLVNTGLSETAVGVLVIGFKNVAVINPHFQSCELRHLIETYK